jgi:outer membrane receptor protein involved in Fe transport
LYNYEFGVRLRTGRNTTARVQAFDSELQDPIVRRTLLFPADRVPAALAGVTLRPIEPTAAQRAAGLTTVAPVGIDSRALKAFVNDGRSRYYGIEANWSSASLARIGSGTVSLEAGYFYILGRDLNPNRNIRRLPPQQGNVRLRYNRSRYWFETSVVAAGAQSRLSGGDADDERIGASRSRADIAAFFNGSRIAPFLTAAGVFGPTGETLAQIQDRVLQGVTALTARVPLYGSTAGWATWNVYAGYRIGEHVTWNAALLNVLDRNYRVHGSGIDSPGVNAYTALRFTF